MDLDDCLSSEWILPNGLGGYSSSTPCGINTRTYHGLLVSATLPPQGRRVVLSKLEEWIYDGEQEFPMSSNTYPDIIYPQGHVYLDTFEWGSNYVKWIYRFPNCSIVKVLIPHVRENAVTVKYRVEGKCEVKILPLVTDRSHHLTRRSGFATFVTKSEGQEIVVREGDRELLRVWSDKAYAMQRTGFWYYNFNYIKDRELGNNYVDDLYNPVAIKFTSRQFELGFGTVRSSPPDLEYTPDTVLGKMRRAALDFLVKGSRGPAIIAGYHWFGEWGRDTMIAMEGILLMNGLFTEAREILQRYIDFSFRGFLPNQFREYDGEPIYRGVDVTLWAINSVYSYYNYTHDKEFVIKNLDKLIEAIEWYLKGNGVVRTHNGLLFHRGAPLTWMDAQYNGRTVTPREGAAVEVNALLYNSLRVIGKLSEEIGREPIFLDEAEKLREAFNNNFVGEHGLYDYIDEEMRPNTSLRPNQIFAASLPFKVVEEDTSRKIVEVIERELLRPFGLSTLSRSDPQYKPIYAGNRVSRDEAYHNGPIWPWLLGAYVDAKIDIEKDPVNIKSLIAYFEPLTSYARANRGFVPELFNDVAPYRQGGCIAQAWSVAEVLRGLSRLLSV
ncbi:glycogen debranching protein [Sulfodiicoccus acidiphilus]|uniref:Glycogen debranching protein n=1 Tax=Sulfodiicoccus acidiphilus TaxID=1670455 RepID=A0A348B0V0_9CREN|nr:amylo-alpha-1,6-glucosidase [Sulfodiicoccus acidiphilus]BBD71802.1 glycogen debranching protein [Sulfodiicoccus acidiphilus]GGT99285.1 glycogen debranching protein [Sulfodiicoccus acidiphilus]